MNTQTALSLVDRLRQVAQLWATAHDASLSRLGKAAVNDGGFFIRLETQVQGTTTATLERFAAYLVDAANWPDGAVPKEAFELAHVTGVTAPLAALSPGNSGENSRLSRQGVA